MKIEAIEVMSKNMAMFAKSVVLCIDTVSSAPPGPKSMEKCPHPNRRYAPVGVIHIGPLCGPVSCKAWFLSKAMLCHGQGPSGAQVE